MLNCWEDIFLDITLWKLYLWIRAKSTFLRKSDGDSICAKLISYMWDINYLTLFKLVHASFNVSRKEEVTNNRGSNQPLYYSYFPVIICPQISFYPPLLWNISWNHFQHIKEWHILGSFIKESLFLNSSSRMLYYRFKLKTWSLWNMRRETVPRSFALQEFLELLH